MSILITGFEPFDGAARNPSWEAVALVPAQLAGRTVHKLQLPTVYGLAAEQLRSAIARIRPEIVLCCGVAGGRKAVTPELVAINYRHARIPDNAGRRFHDQPITADGPAAYMTRLPIHRMIDAVAAAGIPAQLSLSAGAFVCNDVYYALLASEKEFGHRGLFVHVPGEEAVTVAEAARAIAICLENGV